jgi:capsular exopolysaccharide synthesis family protein
MKRAGLVRDDEFGPDSTRRSRAVDLFPIEHAGRTLLADHDLPLHGADRPSAAPPPPFVPAGAAPRPATARSIGPLAGSVEGKTVLDHEAPASSLEEYRRLAASLHLLQAQSSFSTLMVSSALPRDGKTLTATNLALTLSESYGRRVLCIDADLRRPTLRDIFQLRTGRGLFEDLTGDPAAAPSVIEVSQTLSVLTAGTPSGNPLSRLASDRMRAILRWSAQAFDWVIVDTPPVALLPDANILARLVDGVLLVVGAGSTPYADVKRAVSTIGQDRIVGVVLNRSAEGKRRDRYLSRYYAGAGTD